MRNLLPSILLLLLYTGQGTAQQVRCADPMLSVTAASPALASRICEIAARRKPRLRECHLTLSTPIRIEVSEALGRGTPGSLGHFDCDAGTIELLGPAAVGRTLAADSPYRRLGAGVYYDSLVVHELAHAYYDQSTDAAGRCAPNHEYVAYAMQFDALPDPARTAFLQQFAENGPADLAGLNAASLFLDPTRFAARAWRHFSAPGNGCDFIGKLVDGRTTLQQIRK